MAARHSPTTTGSNFANANKPHTHTPDQPKGQVGAVVLLVLWPEALRFVEVHLCWLRGNFLGERCYMDKVVGFLDK